VVSYFPNLLMYRNHAKNMSRSYSAAFHLKNILVLDNYYCTPDKDHRNINEL